MVGNKIQLDVKLSINDFFGLIDEVDEDLGIGLILQVEEIMKLRGIFPDVENGEDYPHAEDHDKILDEFFPTQREILEGIGDFILNFIKREMAYEIIDLQQKEKGRERKRIRGSYGSEIGK
jgi:hypothetical protein